MNVAAQTPEVSYPRLEGLLELIKDAYLGKKLWSSREALTAIGNVLHSNLLNETVKGIQTD